MAAGIERFEQADEENADRGAQMSMDATMPMASAPLYARFSRRLRGIVIDWMISMAVLFGAIFIAVTVRNDFFSRMLGFLVIFALLLYEPLLVSFTGGTLGHYFANLRVVDEGTGGNVSFLKACGRVLIKGLLGWYSFVILAATRRNQAVHDLLTRSTVQIRDPAKARPGQYIAERAEPAASGMPSRLRRGAIISVYLLLLFVALVLALSVMIASGMLSSRCLDDNFCAGGEKVTSLVVAVIWLVTIAAVIALGWKGRLFGARKA